MMFFRRTTMGLTCATQLAALAPSRNCWRSNCFYPRHCPSINLQAAITIIILIITIIMNLTSWQQRHQSQAR